MVIVLRATSKHTPLKCRFPNKKYTESGLSSLGAQKTWIATLKCG